MYRLTTTTPSNKRVFGACLLSFAMLITPIAALAMPRSGGRPVVKGNSVPLSKTESSAKELFVTPPALPAAPPVVATVTASMVDSIENDDADSKIDPTNGNPVTTERILYTATISNSGTDATGLKFTAPLDIHTTLVGSSLNISPLAGNDTYSTIGNTLLEVGPLAAPSTSPKVTVTGSVFDNDTDFLADSFTLKLLQAQTFVSGTVTATSTNGGTVVMEGNGRFSYLPPAGNVTADTFTYTITDDGTDGIAGNADDLTNTGTVTINFSGNVWYVKNNQAAGGLGRSTDPFDTLLEAQTASVAGDTIYVFNGNNTTSGQNLGITLKANQRFVGEGVQLDVPVSVNGGPNPTVLRAAGTAPLVTNTGGNSVTVTNIAGVSIRGFNFTNGGAGNANAIAATFSTAGGGVTISNNSIAGGTANAIDVTTTTTTPGGCTATITNNTITGAGGEGIDINGQGSGGITLDLQSNAVTASGNGIDISGVGGGTLNVSAFANNSVSGASGANGIIINTARFDSVPGGGVDAITAGTTTIGSAGAGNGVGGNGLVLISTTGTLPFTDLDIFADGGTGLDVTGLGAATTGITVVAGVGTITATAGAAVVITATTIDLQLTSISSNGGVNGVSLTSGVNGTFSAGSASSITNASGDDFVVGSGTATISYDGPITSNTGNSVDVSGHTGNTVTFNGLITDTGSGISLTTNGSTTITFKGGLSISTGANPAFTATGGGTVNVCDETPCNPAATGSLVNTLTTTTGVALNVANTTIGANNLEFRSISAGTAASGPANGIILNNTGTSGGLAVSGTGSAGSGGTIQKTTGDGISLTTTEKLSLKYMNIQNNLGDGIGGSGINGFQLNNCSITGNGDNAATDESGINVTQLTGTASAGARPTSITNCTVQNNWEFQIQITNSSGTLTDLTMSSNTISTTAASGISANLFNFLGNGTASMKLTLTSGTFTGNWTPASPVPGPATISGTGLSAVTQGSGGHTVNVSGATFTNNNAGVDCSTTNVANTFSCNVSNNNFQGTRAIAINSFHNGNAPFNRTFNGTFNNNIIGTAGNPNSASYNGRGIDVSNEGAITTANYTITGNTIQEVGILGSAGAEGIGVNVGLGGQATGGGATNVTITGNTIGNIRNSRALIVSDNQDPAFAPFPSICANISGNTITGTIAGQAGNGQYMRVREGSGTVRVTQATPTTAVNAAELDDANGFNDSPAGTRISIGGSPLFSQPACTGSTAMLGIGNDSKEFLAQTSPLNEALQSLLNNPTAIVGSINGSTSTSYVSQYFHAVTGSLGRFVNSLDSMIVPTAYAETEKTEVRSQKSEVGSQRTDVRLNHAKSRRTTNTNALPRAASVTPMFAGETVTFDNGGPGITLPAGKSITITFKATLNDPPNVINNPYPTGGPQVETRGTVSGTNFGDVLTDDPAPPAGFPSTASDPTRTPVDLYNTTTTVTTNKPGPDWVLEGEPVTFTATVAQNQAGSPASPPTGTVQFLDGVTPITCSESGNSTPSLSAGVAMCTTSALTAGAHTINANYNGDGNFDTSGGSVPQTVNACTLNPIVTTNGDTGLGSLRDAIGKACVNSTITFNTAAPPFNAPATIALATELSVTRNMTIDGPDAAANHVTVSGAGLTPIFHLQPGKTATIRDLTLSGGLSSVSDGGAIHNDHGTLTLLNLTISGNTAPGGGGVYNNALISGAATLTIINSTLSGNTGGLGGAIRNASTGTGVATLNVINSTISGNNANDAGGGLANSGDSAAGAVVIFTNATVTNNHSDFDDNTTGDGGGIVAFVGTITLRNTIVAGNFKGSGTGTPNDISGSVVTTSASSNNLIGTGGAGGLTNGVNFNQVGVANPGLGPLANNGGPTQTHNLLFGSPAIEAGDNAFSDAVSLTTDQRGTGFIRKADSADVNTTQTVDIGAIEAQVTIEDIADQSTTEDTAKVVNFNVGDAAQILSVTATSSNTGLVSNANAVITGGGSTRTLTLTPTANQFGTSTITVTITSTVASGSQTMQDTFVLTVTAVGDQPSISSATTPEDTQTTSGLQITKSGNDGAEVTHFKITNITNGLLFKFDGTTPIVNNDVITEAEGNAGLKFTPAANLFSPGTTFSFQAQGAIDAAGNGAGAAGTGTITVTPVADTPTVSDATTLEDTQTSTNLVITKNGNDGAEVTHFKITGITGGTLFKHDGVTVVGEGTFVTVAEASNVGGFGLKFTPAANLYSPVTPFFGFTVQASTSNADAGLGGSLVNATVTVNPVADTPSVTDATTQVNTQTASGLVITRNPVDSTEVSHFKITGITNGTLYKHDGITVINNNDFILVSDAADVGGYGLKFTPTAGLFSPGSTFKFDIQAATSGSGGLGGSVITANITVNPALTLTVNITDDTPDLVLDNICDTDSGTAGSQCSLRAAIQESNFASSDDTINFSLPANSTISLLTPLNAITGNVTITGTGANTLTVERNSGAADFRIFNVTAPGTTSISGLTLKDGKATGGGVLNQSGGGILFNSNGTLNIISSAVTNNLASAGGGGLNNISGGTVNVINSTFNLNSANAGGAMDNSGSGILNVTNSTLNGNIAGAGGGGAIFHGGTAATTSTNCTVSSNTATSGGGGIHVSAGSATLKNTIVAYNTTNSLPSDISGPVNADYSLIGNTTGAGTITGGNNQVNVDPLLGTLANNGGPTQTRALGSGSLALDSGNNAYVTAPPFLSVVPITDQRGTGFPRIMDAADADTTQTVDMGAFEARAAVEDITDKTTPVNTPISFSFNVGDAGQITSVTATSANTTLVPNAPANINVTGSGSSRMLNITPAPNEVGTSVITVTVTSGTESMSDTFTLTVTPVADIQVTKSDSPDPVTASTNITYAISVTNNGPNPAQTVTLTDAVPANTTFVSFIQNTGPVFSCTSPSGGGTGNVSCSLATMASGATATFTMVVNVNANTPEGTTITNDAVGATATADSNSGNNTGQATTLVNQSDIQITSKTDLPDPVTAGNDITYTVNFKNNSAVNPASNVTVTDAVPVGTTLVSASTVSPGWARTDGVPFAGTGNIVFSKALVAASETAVFTIVVKVNANVLSGSTITNTATAATTSIDTTSANNSATATTTTAASADLEITSKTDLPDPVTAGNNITYTINFINNGPSDAQTVTVTDAVPANTTFVSAAIATGTGWSITDPGGGNTGNVVFSKGTVAASETASFTVVVKVNSNTPAATVINNSAAAASATTDGTPGNNTGNASTTVATSADLSVTKVDTPDPVTVGGNLTYTITVTNNGSSDAQTLSLSDTLPPSTTFVSFTLPGGWTRAADGVVVGGTGTVMATAPTLAAGANAVFTLVVNVDLATPHNTVLTNSATVTSPTDSTPGNNTGTTTTTVLSTLALTVNDAGDAADNNVGDRICDTSAAPGDQCTLRAGIQETNAAVTNDTIDFSLPANTTITLTGALDAINGGDLVMTGPASGVTVSGNNLYRVFNVTAGNVSILNLTMANGQSSQGGGIFNTGNLTITNSTLVGNKAVGSEGGAIYSSSGTLTIINSTISGNTSDGVGGGLNNAGTSTATLVNVTITNNRADADGNASGNGGGISQTSSNGIALLNTIVAGNFIGLSPGTVADDINGTVSALSNNNLIGNGGSGGLTNGVNNNQVGVVDARLGVLAGNGGPTQTHALLSGSAALDAGDDSVTGGPLNLTTDQRGTGFPRQADGPDANTTDTVDIGAFEADPSVEDISDKVTNEDQALAPFVFNVGDSSAAFTSITATSSNTTLVPNANIVVGPDTASTRTLSITPAANEFGVTTIAVTVTRGTQSMSDTFLLTVNGVNDPPSFVKGADQTVAEDSGPHSVPGWATSISQGPGNESGQTLTFLVQTNTNPSLFSAGPAISPTGTLTYTLAANANGSATITIALMDNGGGTDTSPSQQFMITVTEVNDAPDAVDDVLADVPEDSATRTISIASLMANDNAGPANETAQTLTFALVPGSAVGGTISSDATNVYFTPTANYSGPASFQYTITDNGTTNSVADPRNDTATVSFTITGGNDAPIAVNDVLPDMPENSAPRLILASTLTANDSKGAPDEIAQTLTIKTVINVEGGTVSIVDGNVVFTPTPNYHGPAIFTYTVEDNGTTNGSPDPKTSNQATVKFNIFAIGSGGVLRFSADNYSVAEGAGFRTITVERSGETSHAITVDYASSDHSTPADSVPCTAPGAGFASSRCDFTTAIGTLRFAAGETSKTFNVLINQDNYVEGTETLELTLSNPTNGAVLDVPQTAILSINDDASEPATNPIDNSADFVRAQYHDILNREPDPGGFAFWTDNIEKCNDPSRIPPGQTVPQCIDKQRESTAIAFFMSPEFQMTGGFAYNLYKGSLTGSPNYDGGSPGRFPTFLEFMHDMSQVSEGIVVNGQISGAVVEANRDALAAAFVQRPEFVAKYGGLDNTHYVQELFNTTGIAASAADKQALVDALNGGESRASVLRKVVDGTVVISEGNVQFTTTYGQAFINQENRRLFVFLEYIGYMRRDPDAAGYNHWLGKLNFFNGDAFQAEMVRAFILSPEYRNRFGQP